MRRFILTFMAVIGLLTSFGQTLDYGKSHNQGIKATQSIIVNEGTSLVSQAPFYSLFCDYGTRSQFIIPASSLTQISGDTISGLTFFSNSTGKTWNETFVVDLKEVNETTFTNPSTFYLDGLTNVFTGAFSTNATGELVINFSTNYIYQGGNLLVSIGTPGMQGGTSGSTSFYGVSTSSVGTYGYNSSGSAGQYNNLPTTTNGMVNIAPKTKITYLSDTAPVDPEDPDPDDCTTENFSNYSASSATSAGVLPTGWVGFTPNGSSSAYAPHVSNSSFSSINGNYLIFTASSSTPTSIAILPKYEDDLVSVQFDYRYESTSYGTLSVGYVTANTLAGCSSYQQLFSFNTTTSVTHYTLTQAQLNQLNENDCYLAFKFYSSNNSVFYTAGIDNLEICIQSCPPSYSTMTLTACDSYTWIDGITYTESNNTAKFVYDDASVTGCDSIVKLNLTINYSEDNNYSVLTCEPYQWHGTTYETSGTYEYDGTTTTGCPLHETLELDIEESIPVQVYASACESYTWADGDGQTYTQTGVYPYTYSTAACDTTKYLNLTVYHTETLEPEIVTACESYEWFGVTYTVDGTYTHYTQLGAGCVRTETLVLTIIHDETAIPEAVAICDSYEWYGETYTESGVYTHDVQLQAGCIRTETLNLTIYTTEEIDLDPVLACDSYEWYGETYTESGNYTHETVLNGGCVLTENLDLTVVDAVHSDINLTTCDHYIWNNQIFEESGDYTASFASSIGCDSVVTLHLTVQNSLNTEINAEACDSYTWNTVNYSNSGDYHQIFASAAGCDSVVTLHLTVKQSSSYEFDTLECPGFIWNDVPYDTEGTYTQIFTSSNGCDSTVTMHLTLKEVPTSQFEVDTCEVYFWEGETYESTGLYYHTYEAANGCDSIVTMILHVHALPSLSLSGEFWVAEGVRDSTTLWAWGGASYLWSTGDTTRYITVSPEHDSTYYITAFNIWGCSVTDSITVVNATGVRESSINLDVYPNPTKNVVNIEATDIKEIRLTDLLGQVLFEQRIRKDSLQIDMSSYAPGTYLLHVMTNDGAATRKIIKR